MARVLGLDLGSHTVKAVVLETTLRGFQVKSYTMAPVPTEGERPARLEAALAQLLAQGPLTADSVVVAVPGVSMATHSLALPFSDVKKVEAALAGEVADQLPFELDEAVYDYQATETKVGEVKGAQVLVGVLKKQELAGLLDQLKASKLDPRIVTHPGLTYQNVLATLPAADVDEAVAVLDLGHERCSLAIGKSGGPVDFARTFIGGGLALTKALAAEFQIPLPEAQTWKEAHGAVGGEVVGPDAERAAGAFMRALQPVIRELRASLKSYAAKMRRPVTRLLLCGGTAKLLGLAGQLERDLSIPTSLVTLPADTQGALGLNAGPEAVQAWALALRGQATGAKAPRFNLRRGEFAFKSDFDFAKDKLGQLVAFGVVLLVLLVASGIARNTILERREKQIDQVVCDTTTRILGKCERNFDIAENLLAGKESPAAGVPKRSAVTLLAEVSQRIPADSPVVLDRVTVDLDRIELVCNAPSVKQMEDMITALKTYKCFKEISEGKVEKTKDGSKVSFRLDVKVECPAEGEGQG
ncbi:MAG: pilus assembly protein PilM [Myxococcaceae bacterium]|jgi:general secretion pathway protein L|nr:pilus assembly protein PilM [Myxococcaceae bacterium]